MTISRKLISSGSKFEKDFAYSRAVVQGNWCFVSGTTGYDYTSMCMPEHAVDQARNAFWTIEKSLSEGGFSLSDIVRVQYTVVKAEYADEVQPVLRRFLGDVRPAATMVVAGLIKPEMKIEIEVTALRGFAEREDEI
ncbi:RidA family protein [Mariniblastus fucicola]|nr:RidA family protein [Mariniblastus fucicola]